MTRRDPTFTPELIKILKIFLFSSLVLVLVLSFFDGYRANNTGKDRTFHVDDSNRIYFQNVRGIYYDREVRSDAGMTLYRPGKRFQSNTLPTLDLVILLNPKKDEAYIYFELKNADWPILIKANTNGAIQEFDFANGNNQEHFELLKKLQPLITQDTDFELILEDTPYPLWTGKKEKDGLKMILEDYFRLLNLTN